MISARIRKHRRPVVRAVRNLQYNPRLSGWNCAPDLRQQTVIQSKVFPSSDEVRLVLSNRKRSARVLDALSLELYFPFQSDGDPGVIRCGPVANTGQVRRLPAFRRLLRASVSAVEGLGLLLETSFRRGLGALESSSESFSSFDLNPLAAPIVDALPASSARWCEDNGAEIPRMSTWLRPVSQIICKLANGEQRFERSWRRIFRAELICPMAACRTCHR